jgi:hypothetical protein
MMDPDSGRFIQEEAGGSFFDSMGGGNPHQFAGNDPVNRTDRGGMWSEYLAARGSTPAAQPGRD